MEGNIREKLYDLKGKKKELLDECKAMALEGKHETDEYKEKKAAMEALSRQIQAVEELAFQDEPGADGARKGLRKAIAGAQEDEGDGMDTVKAFAAAARAGFPATKAAGDYNSEGVPADGGYTVPEDIVTRVERYRQAKASLRELVSVENVTTNKGRRTFKKRSQQTGFTKVAEGGKIGKTAGPQFEVMSYEIGKYAGFLPVTNELLEDSDENITALMVEWIGDEARVTDNKLILACIEKKAKVALDGLDGLKKAVLVDLDAAFRSTCKIVTNANGIYWLSTLKDANGRDLLTPIPSEKGKMQLACGPVVIPVEELPNADLPSDGTKHPFIIGDLKEGIKLFDRKQLTLSTSSIAVAGDFNAYEQDMTITRAIERLDVQQRDSEAYINAYIDAGASAARVKA